MSPELVVRVAVREIPAGPIPVAQAWADLLERLHRADGFWLLESTLADPLRGRFSFTGAAPRAVLRARGGRVERVGCAAGDPAGAPERSVGLEDPFLALRRWLPRLPPDEAPDAAELPFVGGAVGWLGHELAEGLEPVRLGGLDDLALPDAYFLLVDRLLAFEHATGRLCAVALGFGADPGAARAEAERAAERLAGAVARGVADPFEAAARAVAAASEPWRSSGAPGPVRGAEAPGPEPLRLHDAATGLDLDAFFDAHAYGKAVREVQERIASGDVYQANLTHRLAVASRADPWRIYTNLRRISPSPFAAFLATPEVALVGSSPERLLRVSADGEVESRPIKGTRPRGATGAADAALRAELAASEKERAENVMIVDLVRNDLGRVCVAGTVVVPELFAIEPYATVFQMVSTVRGRLRPGLDALDAVRAVFPPGSMTGAPKIAALRLLAGLEPVRRGPYGGALGYLDARGGADLSVVIRTLLARPGRAWLHVGGGIVLDSDPAAEWAETLAKARALLDALAASAG
jgi:para-aminobenzoate synthetase component 1